MNTKILFVDDDANLLAGFQRSLRKQFTIDIALGPIEGLKHLDTQDPYAVIVADMQMPGLNGIQFLTRARELSPDSIPVMLTGNADQKTAMDAVNQGHVFRFLTKPCPAETLAVTLEASLKQHRLITAERDLLEKTLNGAIKALTGVLSIMDPASVWRGEKLRDYVRLYARHYNLGEAWAIELAATLSQIGRVAIPAAVLARAVSGTDLRHEEREMLARVPQTGAELLANIPRLEGVAEIVLYQQKHFDGSGCPSTPLAGHAIPIGARIIKVLSDLIELEGKGRSRVTSLAQLRAREGWYDPDVLSSVAACFDVFLPSDASTEGGCEELPLTELRPGHVLGAGAETRDGALIAPAETMVTPMLLEKLRNFDHLEQLKQPLTVRLDSASIRMTEPNPIRTFVP